MMARTRLLPSRRQDGVTSGAPAAAILWLLCVWNMTQVESHNPQDSSWFTASSSFLSVGLDLHSTTRIQPTQQVPSPVDGACFPSFTCLQPNPSKLSEGEVAVVVVGVETITDSSGTQEYSNKDIECRHGDYLSTHTSSVVVFHNDDGMWGDREKISPPSFMYSCWEDDGTTGNPRDCEQDDNDDDEDDNDGSCRILSNASLNRSNKNHHKQARRSVWHAHVAFKQQRNPPNSWAIPQRETTKKSKNKRHPRPIGYHGRLRIDDDTKTYAWIPPNNERYVGSQKSNGKNRDSSGPTHQSTSSSSPSCCCCCLAIRGGASAMTGSGGKNLGSEVAKRLFVSALVTLVFEWIIGHILEFVKIDMQTSTAEHYTYLDSIRSITSEKGLGGLWDGFIPWGFIQAVFKGSVFGLAHTVASRTLNPLAENGLLPMQLAMCLAGGIAGGFQGYVLSPTLLLKTRVMTDPVFREKMSLVRTMYLSATIGYNVVKEEGSASIMKGSNVFALKRVLDWATRYLFADMFEHLFSTFEKGQSLTLLQKSCASLLGGVLSTTVTLPLDVLVSKIQDAKKAGTKVSALGLFQQELESMGWKGLQRTYMRGFEARLLHVCFTVVVMKTFAPVVYTALFE